jgi:hypothetical protein
MLRVAVLWGGTDRENDRNGMGRFGYGLPSACMSIGLFEVYSKPVGGSWHMAEVDLEEIEAGDYTVDGQIVVPEAKAANLPNWVRDYISEKFSDFDTGTVVIVRKIDTLTWSSINGCRDNLLKHFGVTYNKMRADFDIFVDGVRCDAIDPLFLTPGYRYYDVDAERAQAFDPVTIDVKDKVTKEVLGQIRLRYSFFPLGFASIDKSRDATRGNQNDRFGAYSDAC